MPGGLRRRRGGGDASGDGRAARREAKESEEAAMDATTFVGVASVLNQLTYDVPPVQKDVEMCFYERKLPSSVMPVPAEGVCEFIIEPSGQSSISLFDSFWQFTFNVTYADDKPLAPDEKITPIPYWLNTAFKSVRVWVNGQPATAPTSQTHSIESYLAAMAHLSEQSKQYQLGAAMFLPDTEGQASNIEDGWVSSSKSPFKVRASCIAESQPCIMVGRILHELFLSPCLWPEHTEFRIAFYLQPTNFCIIATTEKQFKFKLTDATLFLCRYKLLPQAIRRQHHLLNTGGLHFTFPRWDSRVVTIPTGLDYVNNEVFRGRCPDKAYVVLVRQNAWSNPTSNLNPLHFSHHFLTHLQLYVNSLPKPAIPYSFTYGTPLLEESVRGDMAYFLLQRESNLLNSSLSFSIKEYTHAMCYFVIDLSADHSAGLRNSYLSPLPDCSITCELKFAQPIKSEPLMAIFVFEHPALLTLSGDKKISITI